LGEHCYVRLLNSEDYIDAEVVGFHNDRVLLMPLGDDEVDDWGSLYEIVEEYHNNVRFGGDGQ
jgi:flagellar biosynthesis/type III secretory pathway ATPase